jgi:type I restriction enzyme S subunit
MRISQDWCRTGYLCLLGKASLIRDRISRLFITTAGQKTVNQGHIGSLLVALPPLAEQSRIVAKVEELMALCDRLEAEQGLATRVQGHWVDAALDQLAESADADEFRRHWQHLAAHFDTLFTTPGSIDRLDATLLQLAVRGKLVAQGPNDEPVSELLEQIRAEKDRLIKEGKIKRDKPLQPVSEDEKPYALPNGWEWGRFSDVILASDAGWSPSCESVPRAGSQWGVLKVSAVTWGEFRPNENKALPDHLDPRPECEVQAGDFLLSRANTEELVARSVVAWEPPERLMLSDKLIRLRLSSLVDKALFCFINNATDSRAHYIANASGTSSSMKNVSREVILSLPVPIPPAQEQSRIVAQVEKLLSLTASLRARLTAAQTKQAHLAEALIAEVTTPIGAALLEGENSGPPQPFDLSAFKARMKAEQD